MAINITKKNFQTIKTLLEEPLADYKKQPVI